jgi:hypothetical protein
MGIRISFWWRDTARLYLRYLIAIAASVPPAVAYSYLATKNYRSWWVGILLLALGLGAAAVSWRWSERLFFSKQEPVLAEACNQGAYGLGLRFAAAALAVSVLCGVRTDQLPPSQRNLLDTDGQFLSAPSANPAVNVES